MSVADMIPGMAPTRVVSQDRTTGDAIITVTPPSFMRLPDQRVRLTIHQYKCYLLWRAGKVSVQEALPDISAADREILMTGIGPEDFARLYAEDDEEGAP